MGSDPPKLGKGIFGYRKSAVNQIIADRDVMLRQAEGRVRAAEAKVAELEGEISSFRERNNRMDEQLERLRAELDIVLNRTEFASAGGAETEVEAPDLSTGTADYEEGFGARQGDFPAGERFSPTDFGYLPPEGSEAEEESAPAPQTYGWVTPEAMQEGAPSIEPQAPSQHAEAPGSASETELPAWARPEAAVAESAPTWAEPAQAEPQPLAPEAADGGSPTPAWWETQVAEAQAAEERMAQEPTPPPPASQPAQPEEWAQPVQTDSWAEPVQPQAAAPPSAPPQPEPAPAAWPVREEPPSPPPAPTPMRTPVAPESVPSPRGDVTSRVFTEELAGILSAAEASAARIVERAQASTERQIMESNRLWREVQAEVARFASWRDQVEPVIRQVQSKVDSARGLVEEVPERIREALAPMADAISSIDADMAELSAALTPPLLLTPTGFEGEGESWLSRAAETSPDYGSDEELAESEEPYRGGDRPGPFGAEAG